jgi:hypothetical protein
MSNSLAIAAVTATLRSLLTKGSGIPNVTARSLDNARKNITTDQVNLFLYQALPDAAWRNQDMPRQVKPGETGHPPLPLVLYYLLTAFSDDDDDIDSHRLLGKAMSILHDHPLLGADEIKNATTPIPGLVNSNLHEQIERLRITLQPLTLEEMSKLWSPFQTQYRFSVAYQVSVVLIESTRPLKAPLPVLKRGPEDRGAIVMAGAMPILEEVRSPLRGTFTGIDDVRLARLAQSAQLGDEIALIGRNLTGDSVEVIFKSPHSIGTTFKPTQIVLNTDQLIIAKLPAPGDPANPNSPTATWPAGFYTAVVMTKHAGEPDRLSNVVAFTLAPAISISPNTTNLANFELTVTCAPIVRPEQRVSLLFNNGEISAKPITANTPQPKFDLAAVAKGEYVVRLRVDGVDSIPIDRQATIPQFADDQKLKVT